MDSLGSLNIVSVRSSSRLEAYSDAIFSIIATVMIVPISHTEIPEGRDLERNFIKLILPQLVVYIFTFMVICAEWSIHVWLFETIEQVDEFTVLLNLVLMMVTTFLPFTFTLLGKYYDNVFAILLFCGIIILVGCIQFLFIFHAFRNQSLLKQEIREHPDQKPARNRMFASVLTPTVFALVSALVVLFSPILADICLLLIVFGNFFRRLAIKMYTKASEHYRRHRFEIQEETPLRHKLMSEMVTKERTECFSDGVFAIVATLIILDICESNVPTQEEIDKAGGLAEALNKYSVTFLTYGGTFVNVGLLWYVHHSLLHYITEVNKLMIIFNNLCLLSIGITPLTFRLTNLFNSHIVYRNETLAIQLSCIFIFFAGIAQMAMWITALFSQERHLRPEGRYGGKDHVYQTCKLAVFPAISLFVYGLSFASYSIKTEAFNAMQIGSIGIFFLLQIAHVVIKKIRRRFRQRSGIALDAEVFSDPDASDNSSNHEYSGQLYAGT